MVKSIFSLFYLDFLVFGRISGFYEADSSC
jgi:hypothetical protein